MKAINSWDTEKGICIVEKKDGKRVSTYIDNVQWYFWMLTEDVKTHNQLLGRYHRLGLLIRKEIVGEYTKIYARKERGDMNIEQFREECYNRHIKLFEFDLSKSKRYLIDNKIPIETDLKVLYFDIETDDSIGNIEIGRDRILCWSACDQAGKTFQKHGDEEKILRSFIRLIDKYDIISGWNSEDFDLPYIQLRCEKYGIKYNWKTIIHLDMLQRAFKLYSYDATHIGLKDFKLKTFASFFLGETKTELDGMKIHQLYADNLDLLLEYNMNDSILLQKLDEKLKITSLMITECELTNSFLNKFYVGELLDNYILRQAKEKGIVLHSKPSKEQLNDMRSIEVAGGYVKTPVKGFYESVHICDFKSLYPSIIVGWNIGIDSLNEKLTIDGQISFKEFLGDNKIEDKSYTEWFAFLQSEKTRLDPANEYIQTANNAFFKKDKVSFVANIVQDFLNLRKEYKQKLKHLAFDTAEYNTTYANERVFKELANSMFGITCEKASRYFNKFTSEGITMTGQFLNKKSAYISEQLGMKVIYGDTDSIFVVGIDDFDETIDTINNTLKKELDADFGLFNNIVFLEYEKKFSKFILLEKKKYSGVLCMKDGVATNKIYSRGTTDVQKSNTTFGRKTYLEAINLIFADNTVNDIINYITNIKAEIFNKEVLPEHLVKHIRISKNVDEYKVDSINKRLVTRLLAEQKITPIVTSSKKVGTRLDYIIIKQHGRNEAILLEELNGHNYDTEYYWVKEIFAPIKRVLKVVFPTVDWDKYDDEVLHPTLF